VLQARDFCEYQLIRNTNFEEKSNKTPNICEFVRLVLDFLSQMEWNIQVKNLSSENFLNFIIPLIAPFSIWSSLCYANLFMLTPILLLTIVVSNSVVINSHSRIVQNTDFPAMETHSERSHQSFCSSLGGCHTWAVFRNEMSLRNEREIGWNIDAFKIGLCLNQSDQTVRIARIEWLPPYRTEKSRLSAIFDSMSIQFS
jgi:hypothetical protein